MVDFIDKIHETTRYRIKDKEKAQIFQAICREPAITRKSIIKELSLRPTSVSKVVSELLEQNLIFEGNLQNDGRKGRPEVELYANYDRFVVISLYVVSKQVKGVLFNIIKQEILAESSVRVPWDVENGQLMDTLQEIVQSLESKKPAGSELLGVGISFLGNVNQRTKELLFSTRWRNIKNFSFRALEEKLKLEVLVYTSLEAQLEYLMINNQNYMDGGILLYHWGYGVGASFASEGKVLRSKLGCIMEIGHTTYNPNSSLECICGNIGCLETECALWALLEKLPFSKVQIPEDEEKFSHFFVENDLKNHDVIKRATKVAASGLSTLYQILFPNIILIESPFLVEESQKELFLKHLYKKIPEYTRSGIEILFLEPGFRGEIFGCTYELFKNRLRKELTVLS